MLAEVATDPGMLLKTGRVVSLCMNPSLQLFKVYLRRSLGVNTS